MHLCTSMTEICIILLYEEIIDVPQLLSIIGNNIDSLNVNEL